MSAGIWFWIIYVVSLIAGGGWYWRNVQGLAPVAPYGLIFYILIGLCGWGIWGAPIK